MLIKQLVGGNNLSVIMSFERGLEQDNCLWSAATDRPRLLFSAHADRQVACNQPITNKIHVNVFSAFVWGFRRAAVN